VLLSQATDKELRGALREVLGIRMAEPSSTELKGLLSKAFELGPKCCDLSLRSAAAQKAQRKRWQG
jgi:hypothetical protein